MNVQPSPIAIAREYWGTELPQWVELLAGECMQSSQNKVAKALDVSPTMISQVLRAKYPGDMQRLEDVFRGVFLSATVDCPARGPLPAQDCYKWRDRARIKEGKGSRVMRRDYGSDLPFLIDAPMNDETMVDVYAAAAEAIDLWEPEFALRRVEIVGASAGRMELRLTGDDAVLNVEVAA